MESHTFKDIDNYLAAGWPPETKVYLSADVDAELETMNLAVGYFHEENDRFITRIADLELAAKENARYSTEMREEFERRGARIAELEKALRQIATGGDPDGVGDGLDYSEISAIANRALMVSATTS